MTSLQAIFGQKSYKCLEIHHNIFFWSNSPKKTTSTYVKQRALQNDHLGFSKIFIFHPTISKSLFLNPIKPPKVYRIFKNGIYVMKTSICYTHATFWGNPSVLGHRIAKNPRKLQMIKFIEICGRSRLPIQIKIPPVNSPSKHESDRHQFCFKRPT